MTRQLPCLRKLKRLHTVNIHTHLIPFLLWGASLIPMFNSAHGLESPEILFMSFALLCLLSSAIWHTMSGCADHDSMEMCARVDYVGIGWSVPIFFAVCQLVLHILLGIDANNIIFIT